MYNFSSLKDGSRLLLLSVPTFYFPMRQTTLTRHCSISIRIALISFGGVCLGLSSNEASPNEPTVSAKENSLVPLAGHSEHGAAFNEGPRQDAYIMYGTGKVHFPVTTSNEQAQQFFDQGVGQLHGFWFYEAERSFRRTRQLEPACAMASWGMAMANLDNAQRARQFIGEAVNKIELQESSTERERFFVDSLAKFLQEDKRDETQRHQDYIKTLEKIIRKLDCFTFHLIFSLLTIKLYLRKTHNTSK